MAWLPPPPFLWGCLGAVAPEVVRLYKIVTGGNGSLPKFNAAYLLISVVFVLMGGAVALAWGETTPWKCIWIGASLPVLISSLAAQKPPDPPAGGV